MYRFEKREDVPLTEGYLNMGGRNSVSGESFYANNLYYTKNGEPFLPVMGEMHITRCERGGWRDRILKLKAQGIQIISSYLMWIHHEFYEGSFDFSGGRDIRTFVEMCKDEGLYVALRIGPWISSECRGGGLPDWIYDKEIQIRTNDEQYLFFVRRWYRAIYEEIKDLLFENGGNIIIVQFDNELVGNPEHIRTLRIIANEIGITAPLYTATGWCVTGGAILPKRDVIPMFGGYSEKPWDKGIKDIKFYAHFNFSHIRNAADVGDDVIDPTDIVCNIEYDKYPYSMCEMGMGGNTAKHRRPYISAEDNYAFAITKLGSGCNLVGYYMSCGGKNPIIDGTTLNFDNRQNKSANIYPIFNYDFQASLREHGNCTRTHRKNKIIHYFLHDFGNRLAVMQPKLQIDKLSHDDKTHLRYAMRIDKDGGGYIFVNHHCHNLPLEPIYNVRFEVKEGAAPIPANPIDITEDDAFFFPFDQDFGGTRFSCITAQPICCAENTVFFKKIKGVEPIFYTAAGDTIQASVGKESGFVYSGVRFIVLGDEEAECLYRFDERIYIGDGCDLVFESGEVLPVGFALGRYFVYEGGSFTPVAAGVDLPLATLKIQEVESPDIDKCYQYELFLNRDYTDGKNGEWHTVERRIKYYEIYVDNKNGYVHIDFSADSAQLYYDGVMCDDCFYSGNTWIIPAAHMYGKKTVLALAEYTHDIYVEIEPKQDLGIDNICVKAV